MFGLLSLRLDGRSRTINLVLYRSNFWADDELTLSYYVRLPLGIGKLAVQVFHLRLHAL